MSLKGKIHIFQFISPSFPTPETLQSFGENELNTQRRLVNVSMARVSGGPPGSQRKLPKACRSPRSRTLQKLLKSFQKYVRFSALYISHTLMTCMCSLSMVDLASPEAMICEHCTAQTLRTLLHRLAHPRSPPLSCWQEYHHPRGHRRPV